MRTSSRLVMCCLMGSAALVAGQQPDTQPTKHPVLRVATRVSPPFAFQSEDGTWTGISIELWRRVAESLNMEFTLHEMPLDRIIDELAAGRVDAAVAAISVTPARERRIDFCHPFYTTGLGVAVPAPQQGGVSGMLRQLFTPAFFKIVFILIALTATAGILFWLAERRSNPALFGDKARRGVREGVWWATIVLLGHKGLTPTSTIARVLAASGMLASLLALSTLTGAIASVLTVSQLETGFQHPDDLRRARLVTVENSTSAEWLRARRLPFEQASTAEAALDALAAGDADAVVYDAPMLKYVTMRQFAETLRILPWTLREQEYAIALPPNSPLRESINRSMLRLLEEQVWEDILFQFIGE